MRQVRTKTDITRALTPDFGDLNKYLGIEIEFCSPYCQSKILDDILSLKLQDYVQLKHDGSIHAHRRRALYCGDYECRDCRYNRLTDFGHELCVLVKEKDVVSVMARIEKLFKKIGAYTNYSCGLHIHLDMRYRDEKRSFYNLARIQDVLYKMVEKRREDSQYCQPVPLEDLSFEDHAVTTRYSGINARAFFQHDTLEVRLHHGTINAKEIALWSKVLVKAVECGVIKDRVSSSLKLARAIKADKQLRRFVVGRVRKFAQGRRKVA